MLRKIKEYFMPTKVEEVETPVETPAVTEADQWDYVLFGNK